MKKKYLMLYSLILLVNMFVVSSMASTTPISIYSPDFSPTYLANWSVNGNSVVVGDRLRLTDDLKDQKGSIFWTSKVCNSDGLKFSAFFSFQIDKSDSQADGITFIIQQYSNLFGEAGEGMGYQGLPDRSIAIEYDTYKNTSQNDPDNGHIAVDINGSVNHTANASFMGIPSSSLLVEEATLVGMGIDIADHDVKYSWIDYDGTNLQVRISTSPERPVTPIIDIAYDLVSYFDGASTFYGFGSATGASREKHYIESVYIHNRYSPIDIVNNTYEQGDFSTSSVTNVSICQGEEYLFNGVNYSSDTICIVNLTNSSNCDSTATLMLDVRPSQTIWTGNVDGDWFNDDNWNPKYPTACSDVIIPDLGNGVQYPVINSQAICNSITFEPGGAVLGLPYLTYDKAYVQLQLRRNSWYTLTAPLKSMFSGDYYFAGDPRSFMQLFDDINPDHLAGECAVGTWTASFANNEVPLTPGMGFAFLVDSFSYNYPDGPVSQIDDKIVYFPSETSPGVLSVSTIPISGLSGKPYPNLARPLPRDELTAYRFAMENASNELEDVRVPIKEGLNLVGNPLMTHLDFDALYSSNEDKIENKVKFWNGSTFITYMAGSGICSDMDLSYTKIPPMQAFFVAGKSGLGEDTQLDINLNEHFVADTLVKLRSASTPKDLLQIKSTIKGLKSSTVIAKRNTAKNGFDNQDAFKLFTHLKDVPEIYTMADFKSLDINQFNSLPYMVPIGVKTGSVGFVLLDFIGANSFEGMDVTLLNTMTGEQQNLKANNQYTLYNDGVLSDGNLFVEFRAANTTANLETNSCTGRCVHVYCENGVVYVTSPPEDKITRFTLWEELGTQVCNVNDLNTNSYEVKVNASNSQICVARVQTKSRTYVVKIMMK